MREIIIKDKVVLVDDDDYENLIKFNIKINFIKNRFYSTFYKKNRGIIYLHRHIMELDKGDKRVVDHINGNPLDNRKCNLRICTQAQNVMNRKINKNNTSGYKGVYYHKKNKNWIAKIQLNREVIYLGAYETVEKAYEISKIAYSKHYGEYANYQL